MIDEIAISNDNYCQVYMKFFATLFRSGGEWQFQD